MQNSYEDLLVKSGQFEKDKLTIPEGTRLIILGGIGDGSYLHAILQRVSDSVKIVVYEPDEGIRSHILAHEDTNEWEKDGRVQILWGRGDAEKDMYEALDTQVDLMSIQHMYAMVTPGYTEVYPQLLKQINDGAKTILRNKIVQYNTVIINCRLVYKNNLFALSVLRNSSTIARLFRAILSRDIPLILVGAGPSLEKNASELAQVNRRAIIVACTRAVNTLEQHGVKADIIATIDALEGYDYTSNDVNRAYPVLFHPQAAKDIQGLYAGRGIYMGFDTAMFPFTDEEEYKKDEKEEYGGSVMTALLSVFLGGGFSNFILTGMDLAFSDDGQMHSGEADEAAYAGKIYETDGIYGGRVKTRSDWMMFREFIEDKIADRDDIHVIDASEGGALIHGTEVMGLRDALSGMEGKEYPISEWLSDLPKGEERIQDEAWRFIAKVEDECGRMQVLLSDAIFLNDTTIRQIKSGKTDQGYQEYFRQYDHTYQELIDDKTGVNLKHYCMDVMFEYADRAADLNGEENTVKRLELEGWLFGKMREAASELMAYIRELRAERQEN